MPSQNDSKTGKLGTRQLPEQAGQFESQLPHVSAGPFAQNLARDFARDAFHPNLAQAFRFCHQSLGSIKNRTGMICPSGRNQEQIRTGMKNRLRWPKDRKNWKTPVEACFFWVVAFESARNIVCPVFMSVTNTVDQDFSCAARSLSSSWSHFALDSLCSTDFSLTKVMAELEVEPGSCVTTKITGQA